jgi:CheY-like chemotaxis protein
MRLLEKDPTARFPNMHAVVERLEDATLPSRTVLDQDTEPMILRPSFAVKDAGDLTETVIRICERVSTLSAPDFVQRAVSDAPAAARSVARRLALGEEAEMRAALAVAIRDLADRARLSIQSEEMVPLIPRQVADLVLAVDRVGDDGESDPLPQVVSLVEAYYRATRPRDGSPRSSPRRAVLDLKAQVGSRYTNEIVEALVEHLREVVSALDLAPAQPDAPRILLAGVPSDALMHALEFDGFAIEAAADGHVAWEKLRKDPFSGAIVDAALPGRDALSLLKLCRAHPDTEKIAFLILGHEGPASELEGVAVLERSAALDSIRASLRSLITR